MPVQEFEAQRAAALAEAEAAEAAALAAEEALAAALAEVRALRAGRARLLASVHGVGAQFMQPPKRMTANAPAVRLGWLN